MSKFRYLLLQIRSKLWVKPALTGLVAVGWVEGAYVVGNAFYGKSPIEIDRELLFNLLQILASTMLTVAIFAVTAMVGAFSSVATTATPRATRIVMQDRSAQNALSAFLSAFIYAIVALVALSALSYGAIGRLLLFGGYVFIVFWVLVSFIRWVDQVTRLGRMNDTIRRVEETCLAAFTDPAISGRLGACVWSSESPDGVLVYPERIGYLQYIDMPELQAAAKDLSATIRILARPGAFMDRNRPLAVVIGGGDDGLDEDRRKSLAGKFTIGDERQAESDPRFGLLMLAEIADRALSPAVNDPGTAIAVIGAQVRLISEWADSSRQQVDCQYPDLEAPDLLAEDLLEDAFSPIARDGAAMFEVGARLQKAFLALLHLDHGELSAAAVLQSGLALEQSLAKLPTDYHRGKMAELAAAVTKARSKAASAG